MFEVSNYLQDEIKIIPENLLMEVAQNIRTIISTRKFTAPLDRGFGIDVAFLDEPIAKTQAKISAEIVKAVKEFEPRARVTNIFFDGNFSAGELKFRVQFKLKSTGV